MQFTPAMVLSENTDFAQACIDNQITFIGPTASAIELMGSKRLSKIAMIEAGVPCVPGYEGDRQDLEYLATQAEQIGFPIMVKASAGGGGRGMRLVQQASELFEALQTARSEAENAFGSGELILEKAVIAPRHVEIQVLVIHMVIMCICLSAIVQSSAVIRRLLKKLPVR